VLPSISVKRNVRSPVGSARSDRDGRLTF